jgi:site-specific DNA recombinase
MEPTERSVPEWACALPQGRYTVRTIGTHMKAYGYVRVSTTGQADDGVSLEAQQERIAAWCSYKGLPLSEVFQDAGKSGKAMKRRPGLQAALDAACEERGVLVVYSLSRLSRSLRDTLLVSERIQRSEAQLASLSEEIDTTTATGTMFFQLLAVLAEFERNLVRERTRTAMAHLRRSGRRVSGEIPYGWRLASDGRSLRALPKERKFIDLMAELREGGMSFRAVARELDARGVPTKTGSGSWSGKVVRDILLRRSA